VSNCLCVKKVARLGIRTVVERKENIYIEFGKSLDVVGVMGDG
jgi:hypothetical protein